MTRQSIARWLALGNPANIPLLVAVAMEAMTYGAVFALIADLQDKYDLSSGGLGLITGSAFAASVVTQLTLARLADHGHAVAMSRIGGIWRLAAPLRLLPLRVRNAFYAFVARNRYSWFGKLESCPVPSPEVRARFLP